MDLEASIAFDAAWEADERNDQDAYLNRLMAGMCPHCGGTHTVNDADMYAAVATRYCEDCGVSYVAEW